MLGIWVRGSGIYVAMVLRGGIVVPSGGIQIPSVGTMALSGGILAQSSGNKQVIFIPILSVFVMITWRKTNHGVRVFSNCLQPFINSALGEERARARVWLSGGVLAQTWLLGSIPSPGAGER